MLNEVATYESKETFNKFRCLIVIPTYNNEETVVKVIQETKFYADEILVVNDGSTDTTETLLADIEDIHIVKHAVNQGKGKAIRNAFAWAIENNFEHIITIDSDGQHYPSDLNHFAEKLEESQDSIFLGSRNLTEEENINGKSSFANKFSNFWFWVETGYRMPDTQTGYRLYPVHLMKDFKWVCQKYEFEIEVLVRSAWAGIKVKSVPIQVYYPPQEERVSHFRPLKDFTRISILNTVLVLLAFLFFRPRMIYREARKKTWRQIIKEDIFISTESNYVKALSIGFGVFMGIFPIWGWQLAVAIPLAILLRLNKSLVFLAANISIFPFTPVVWFSCFFFGGVILGVDVPLSSFDFSFSLEAAKSNIKQFIIGGIALSIIAGLFFGFVSYLALAIFRKRSPEKFEPTPK